jgi:hypothetical protein
MEGTLSRIRTFQQGKTGKMNANMLRIISEILLRSIQITQVQCNSGSAIQLLKITFAPKFFFYYTVH